MFKKIIIFILLPAAITAFNYLPAVSAEKDITFNAAEYICAKAREGKKTRLAVYAFTNDAGDISSETRSYSTKIMALILDKKEFKVIDPESIPDIISEQEKGMTGLIDSETAAETGKMIGADALVFGITGSGSLQVRIIDSTTGEVIGATLEENDGKTKIKNEDFKSPEGKKKFMAEEFERSTRQIYNNHPMYYLFITANETELAEMEQAFPAEMNRIKQRISDGDPAKAVRLEKRKKKLADFRNANPGFDNRIRESRKSLMEQLKDKKKRKKKK
jgi:hypothetical protein